MSFHSSSHFSHTVRFARGVLALLAIVASLVGSTPRVNAQVLPAGVTVFNPAEYAQLVTQLASSVKISTATAISAAQLLNMYNDMVKQGTVNINAVWNLAEPQMQKTFANAQVGPTVAITAANMLSMFQREYPQYSPNQPYTDLYAISLNAQRNANIATMTVAKQLAQHQDQLATARGQVMNQTPDSRNAYLAQMAKVSAIQSQQLQDLHGLVTAQVSNEANYYQTMMATEQAKLSQPGYQRLMQTFEQVPQMLGGSTVPTPTHT